MFKHGSPALSILPRARTTRAGIVGFLAAVIVVSGTLFNAPANPARDGADAPVIPNPPDMYECHWTPLQIQIDGHASEQGWGSAPVLENFFASTGEALRPVKGVTRARLLLDRQYLYFFAEMQDGDLFAEAAGQEGSIWTGDAFGLFLKPAADKPGYSQFAVNPGNALSDLFFPSRDAVGRAPERSDGKFDIKTAVQLRGSLNHRTDRDQGWSVEGRIAWKSLLRTGGRPNPNERWTFALARADFSAGRKEPALFTNAPLGATEVSGFHRHEDYATIRFVGPAESAVARGAKPLPIRKALLTTSRVVGSPDPPHPYRVVPAFAKLSIKHPIFVTHQPGSNRLLLIGQDWSYGPSQLLRIVDDEASGEIETLLRFDDSVAYSIAFHPRFLENGYLYLGLNGPSGAKRAWTRVVRYRMDPQPPYAFDPASATMMIEWESNGHNGGAVAFGPDGMLYVTSGDGTSDSDTWASGQDLTRPLAKLLRIDVDRPAKGKPYSIPKDNPFVGRENVVPETYAYGFRNPWRLFIDSPSGQIWIGQNGEDQYEQVYLIQRGANYGWSVMEGSHPFHPNRQRGPDPIQDPTAEHPHSVARSLTGGIVYRGSALPELVGAYLYGDYSTGKIWAIRHDGQRVTFHQEIADSLAQITSFGTDGKGELLITDHGRGILCRLEPTPPGTPRPQFPAKLSESGLFASVRGHVMQPGVIPYSVNAELWSDGAHKERWIAIPHKEGEDRRIDLTLSRGWNFPDETVLVKSFALETEAGNPASRRWIETRFLTKQDGEWAGYSYVWDEDGADATLVPAQGMDRTFSVRDPSAAGGERTTTWHYPSRTECMVCHTRAANFVLGPQMLQMNKRHDYGDGQARNQLEVLEQLGMLRVDWTAEATAAIRADAAALHKMPEALEAYIVKVTNARDQRGASASTLLFQPPDQYQKLVNPYDTNAELTARAKSYLHANCAFCHVEAGGGNARMELEFTTRLPDMRLVDEPPLHQNFGLPDARLVAPGAPQRSVLLHRMSARGPGQMPPLATNAPDEAAIELLRDWIGQVEAAGE